MFFFGDLIYFRSTVFVTEIEDPSALEVMNPQDRTKYIDANTTELSAFDAFLMSFTDGYALFVKLKIWFVHFLGILIGCMWFGWRQQKRITSEANP